MPSARGESLVLSLRVFVFFAAYKLCLYHGDSLPRSEPLATKASILGIPLGSHNGGSRVITRLKRNWKLMLQQLFIMRNKYGGAS